MKFSKQPCVSTVGEHFLPVQNGETLNLLSESFVQPAHWPALSLTCFLWIVFLVYFNLFGYSPLALLRGVLGPFIRKACALSPTRHYQHQETESLAGRRGRKLGFKIPQFGTS